MRSIKIFIITLVTASCSILGSPAFSISERDCVVKRLKSCVGVREATGHNDGPEVKKYLNSCGLPEGNSWCGALLNFTFKACGIETPKGAAWAPSWFPEERLIFKHSFLVTGKKYTRPQPGCVIGIYYKNKGRTAHVGGVIEWGTKTVRTVEGNTSGGGSREGDGVYYMVRPIWTIYEVADWINKPPKS